MLVPATLALAFCLVQCQLYDLVASVALDPPLRTCDQWDFITPECQYVAGVCLGEADCF